MEQNFWYWIVISLVEWVIHTGLPLFPNHQHWDLYGNVLLYGGELSGIMFVFMGQFVSFRTFATMVPIIVMLEIWKNKGKIIKIIGILRFLL